MKYVGLITYDYPHLKTEQVLLRLLRKNYKYKIFALPFVERKAREVIIRHRPDQFEAVAPNIIAQKHGIEYNKVGSDKEIDNSCDIYLILGGGILSPECVKNKRILNCHPGIIPAVRGLDAFKWAIYEMKPLGVTLHFIDAEVDAGEIVAVVPTEIYITDNLNTLARRHYENEIEVLVNFDIYLENPQNPFKDIEKGEPHRRMPLNIEKEMVQKFSEYVKKYGK